ncbi:hypothetical protein AAG570_012351 [Ranatra chinensis]|uniref:Zinc finger protein Xfin n=1 Tax=Ranatra chinensis TaxID=642074 RepID=A0ABD0Z6X4_9HEMI
MSQPLIENYDDLCRLCASYDAIKMDIFSDRGKERRLLDKITTCLPFQVSEDDLLPKSLCYRCIYNLENFYDFRRGCIDALARLENVIKRSFTEVKTNDQVDIIKSERSYEDDIILESEGEQEPPNPADFLEACLGEAPQSTPQIKRHFDEEEGPFRCETCSRLFNSRSSLTIHAKFHRERQFGDDREVFSCYVCDKIFSSKGHLALHSRVHIGEAHSVSQPAVHRPMPTNIRLYKCDLCSKSYSMAKHLWGHVSTCHRGDPLVTCNMCLRTFSSITNLEDHKRVKHKNNNLEQQVKSNHIEMETDESKLNAEEMSSNKRKSSKPRKIERESGSVNGNDEEIEEEQEVEEIEEGEIINTAQANGEGFAEQTSLSHHLLAYHNTDVNVEHNFSREAFIESQFAESMMEAETIFCCEICIREFSDKASLWLHMLYSHRDEASKACGICLKICLDNDTLIQHVEMCHPRDKTEQRRYSCQVCARQHDSRKKLVTHAKIHKLTDADGNLIDPESVVVLNSEFYATESPINHAAYDDRYMMHCEICYKIFETEAKLVKHKRSAHRDSMGPNSSNSSNTYHYFFACEICGLSHSTRTDRWRHMATTHAGDPSVTCELEECGKVFPTSAIKRDHAENHHSQQGPFPNTCEVCGKMWKTRVEYWKHMMGVHSDCLPYICGVCLKVFCDMGTLVSHVRTIHWPLVGGDFCCDICGRPYSKLSKMTRHRKIHNIPDNPPELKALLDNPKIQAESHFLQQPSSYSCDLCEGTPTEYENLEDLNEHRRTAHNVMPCDLCTKYYGRTSHLWKHVNKIHKGHPEITCQLCQRTSASRLHLANHMAKHHRSEDPNYTAHLNFEKQNGGAHKCEKCSKVFRKESLMKKHMKHCKGPRPPTIPLPAPVNGIYTCEKCSKTFTVQNTLYKHMRSTHLAHGCELCEKMVDSKTELYNHMREEHADHPDVKCDVKGCDKIFRCKVDLERHKKDHRQYNQLHICKFCAELVTSKLRMRKHLKTVHGKDTKHLCAICLKALPNYDDLKIHVEENHAVALSRPNTCPVCGKPCQSKSKLLDHIKYHGSTFHPCKICFKIFESKEKLNDHISNHPTDSCDEEDQIEEVELDPNSIMDIIGAPKNEIIEVNRDVDEIICKRKNESPDESESDAKKPKLEFCCSTCEESFVSQDELNVHENEFHMEATGSILESVLTVAKKEAEETVWDTGESDVSDRSFMQQLGLVPDQDKTVKIKNNRKVYTDDFTPSTCEVCGKVWPAKRHLWQHLIRFHRTEAGTSCGVCLKLCSDYTVLAAHLAMDHPQNFEGDGTNLTCKACGKYHNARSKLQNHVAIHIGHEERALASQHQCLHCDKSFVLYSHLCEHNENVHNYATIQASLDRPVKSIVGTELQNLAKHMPGESVGHRTKERGNQKLPFYSCDVCSLVFASEIGLTNHRRMHEHSDNFKCGQCGEVLPSAEALGSHKLTRHRGAEFVCADCKSNFTSYKQLTEHNKLCKIKLKNSEREGILDDESENMDMDEGSSILNGTANDFSSSETDLDKTEDNIEDDEDVESDVSDIEEQKSTVSIEESSDEQGDDDEEEEEEEEEDEEEVNSIEEEFDDMVEVVEVDVADTEVDIDGEAEVEMETEGDVVIEGEVIDNVEEEVEDEVGDDELEIEDDIEDDGVDVEDDMEGDDGVDVEDDMEDDVEGEVEDDVEGEVEDDVEGEVEDDVEGEVEDDVEGEVEDDVEGEVEDDLEGEVEDNVEDIVEDVIEGDVEDDVEGDVEDGVDDDVDADDGSQNMSGEPDYNVVSGPSL